MDVEAVTIDALRSFAAFAEHRNFTRAAAELHISQPALHVKVSKLGAALGVRLYERDGRDLHLTSAGRRVAAYATDVDADLRRFVADLAPASASAPVVVAAGAGAHLHVLAAGTRRLLERGVEVRLLTGDADATVAAVRAGTADIGVAVLPRRSPGLTVRPLAAYPQVLVTPADHPLARSPEVHLADLSGAALVLPPPGRPHRTALDRALRRQRVATSVAVEVEGWGPMLRFVALGVGLAVVNGCVTVDPDLVARPVVDLPIVTYSLVTRPGATDDRVTAAIDVLRAGAP